MEKKDIKTLAAIIKRIPNWSLISAYLNCFSTPKSSIVKVLGLESLLEHSDFPDVWMPTRSGKPEIYDKRQASRGLKKGKAAKKFGMELKRLRAEIVDGKESKSKSRTRGRLSRKPNSPIFLSAKIERMQIRLEKLLSKFEAVAQKKRAKFSDPNIQGKRATLARDKGKKFSNLIHPAKRYRLIAEIMEWRVRYELGANAPRRRIFTAESVRKYIERHSK